MNFPWSIDDVVRTSDEDAVRQYMEQGLAVAEVLPTSAAARCFGRIADYFAFRLTPAPRLPTPTGHRQSVCRNAT